MPYAIELVMRCASADAELTPALGALQEACGRPSMPSAPRGIDLVFRCASADHEYSELAGLKFLRDAAISSGTTRTTTPGGGMFVAQSALELVLNAQSSDANAAVTFSGLRALINADTPAAQVVADLGPTQPADSRPGTGETGPNRRDMGPAGYRLPALGSKPQTPTLQRRRVDPDETLSDALPPITVYDSASQQRPGSRQYQYKPKPTGEGLARVLSFASRSAALPQGLFALHAAVVAVKHKQPHRLVKIPVGGVWRERPALPGIYQPKKSEHVDATSLSHTDGGMSAVTAPPPLPQRLHGRLSTARRIDRKLEELRVQVSHLNSVRSVRQTHNARLMARTSSPAAGDLGGTLNGTQTAAARSPNKGFNGTLGSTRGGAAGPGGGNLRGSRRQASPNATSSLGGTLSGTLSSKPQPVSVVDAILASRTGTGAKKYRGDLGHAGGLEVSPPTEPPPMNRAPVVPHRGLRAAANQKPIPAQTALHETLL